MNTLVACHLKLTSTRKLFQLVISLTLMKNSRTLDKRDDKDIQGLLLSDLFQLDT